MDIRQTTRRLDRIQNYSVELLLGCHGWRRLVVEISSCHFNAMMSSGLVIKKSNIRIWIHQRNITSLQQVIWEGHGAKLLVEHSNNAKVKKFLEAVPHIMVREDDQTLHSCGYSLLMWLVVLCVTFGNVFCRFLSKTFTLTCKMTIWSH